MSGYQPVAAIDAERPSPSLLTVARALPGSSLSEQPDDTGLPTWRTGVGWSSYTCQHSRHEQRCTDLLRPVVGAEDQVEDADAPLPDGKSTHYTEAFRYYTPMRCDWVLEAEAAKLTEQAQALTEARAPWAVSRALWLGAGLPATLTDPEGDTIDTPTLRSSGTDVSIGGLADAPDDVFAQLLASYEEATDGLGGAVLHVPTPLMPALYRSALVRREGDKYVTAGAMVSPGPGYPFGAGDYGPQDEAAASNEVWVFITGPVQYALGQVRVVPDDESQRRGMYRRNQFEVWAEREAIVRFDPCTVFGALVDSPAGVVS